jgi:hypothetical protein
MVTCGVTTGIVVMLAVPDIFAVHECGVVAMTEYEPVAVCNPKLSGEPVPASDPTAEEPTCKL